MTTFPVLEPFAEDVFVAPQAQRFWDWLSP